jgi:hypothetical protein
MNKSSLVLPRFTIRTLLAILTAAAVVFVMVGTAFRGQYWAWGVTIGIISCIITALSHSAWFGIVWFFGRLPDRRTELSETAKAPLVPADATTPAENRSDQSTRDWPAAP